MRQEGKCNYPGNFKMSSFERELESHSSARGNRRTRHDSECEDTGAPGNCQSPDVLEGWCNKVIETFKALPEGRRPPFEICFRERYRHISESFYSQVGLAHAVA